jgi:hypothetical protein
VLVIGAAALSECQQEEDGDVMQRYDGQRALVLGSSFGRGSNAADSGRR